MDVRTDRASGLAKMSGAKNRFGVRAAMIFTPIGVLVAGIVLLQMLNANAPKPEKSTEDAAPISVEIAAGEAIERAARVTAQGEVRAKTQAEIAAQISGQVTYVSPLLEAGASVRRGEVLARIEAADYRLAVDRARSQVARAREAYERIRAEAALAEQDWRQLGLAPAPSDLTLFKPQVAAAKADLDTAEAAVKEAQLNLSRTEFRAPFDGRVASRRVDLGDLVVPGALVATIFSTDAALVRIPLTDENLRVLGVAPGYGGAGLPARLSAVVAGERREWNGALSVVEAAVDSQTRLIYGLVSVDDPFGADKPTPLAPGLFVTVELVGAEQERFVAVPRAALKKNEFVYVVGEDNAITARTPVVAMADGETIFVRDGLAAGERVVVSYLPSPRDGMKVRDIREPLPPAPAAQPEDAKGKKAKKKAPDKTAAAKPE